MHTFKKLSLIALTIMLALFVGIFAVSWYNHTIFFFEHPQKLNPKRETIEVFYVEWGCECPNWLEVKYFETGKSIKEEDCIFIESSNINISIPKNFKYNSQKLSLTGHFYEEKGFPNDYIITDEGKPDKAKIFKYQIIEVKE
jgi:hypothetical protein